MRRKHKDGRYEVRGDQPENLKSLKTVSSETHPTPSDTKTNRNDWRTIHIVTLSLALFMMSIVFSMSANAQTLPAFPGAEGGGATSVGGRGGAICEVTTLQDLYSAGSDSLRSCINMKGPRIVVFRVAGTIVLGNPLFIINPYITIAGQTAPGGGIQLKGNNGYAGLRINTHDVVIRYLRIRKGYRLNSGADTVGIESTTTEGALRPERIVLDHVSIFWGSDENVSFWGSSTEGDVHIPNHISIQNSIIAEPFAGHPAGLLAGSDSPANSESMINIDITRNLFAHIGYRSPLFKNHHSRFVNNVVYHWGLFASVAGYGSFDFIGNLYKHPNPNAIIEGRRYEIMTFIRDPVGCATNNDTGSNNLQPSIYAVGNSGPWHSDPEAENYIARINCHSHGVHQEPLPAEYRRSSPLPPAGVPISILPVTALESSLLPIVGASHRLDCMGNLVENRDTADSRIVTDALITFDPEWGDVYNSNYQQFGPAHEDDVSGFPVLASGTPCTDTDHDGMPDQWETTKGLNPDNPTDGSVIHTSGYSNVERYLNGESATTTPCNTVTTANFSQATYSAYGAPFDAFQTSVNLMNATCTSADTHTVTLTTGITGDETRIVLNRGYYLANNTWIPYTGVCNGIPDTRSPEWCRGSISTTITDLNISTASSTNPTYLVGMTCSVQGGGWRCGCRNTSCTNFYWMIQGAGQ